MRRTDPATPDRGSGMFLLLWMPAVEPVVGAVNHHRLHRLEQQLDRLIVETKRLRAEVVGMRRAIEQDLARNRIESDLGKRIAAQAEKVLAAREPTTRAEAKAELVRLIERFEAARERHKAIERRAGK